MGFIEIKKDEFDKFIKEKYKSREFYLGEYEEIEKNKNINECCYLIKINDRYLLIVYSSFWRDNNKMRGYASDSIKITPVDSITLEPVRPKFPHVKRTDKWKLHFQERISEIIASLGYDNKCNFCGKQMFLRYNKKDDTIFIGCSGFPKCNYSRNL